MNAGTLYAGTLGSQVLTGVTYLCCARGLASSDYGSAAAGISVATLFVAIVDFGGASHELREVSAGRRQPADHRRWINAKSALVLGAAPLCGSVSALAASSRSLLAGILLGAYFAGVSLAMILGVALRAQERFGVLSALAVAARFAPAVVAATMATTGLLTASGMIFLLAVGGCAEAMALWVASGRWRGRTIMFRRRVILNPYTDTFGFGMGAVANNIGIVDVAVIAGVANADIAGGYAAVSRWMAPIGLVSQAVTQAIFPRLSSVDRNGRRRELRDALRLVLLSVPILCVVAAGAPWIVLLLLGAKYASSGDVLRLICVALVFAIFSQPLSGALSAWGHERSAARSVGAGQLCQLASQAALAYHWGAAGGAAGAAVGQAVTLFFLASAVSRRREDWHPKGCPADMRPGRLAGQSIP